MRHMGCLARHELINAHYYLAYGERPRQHQWDLFTAERALDAVAIKLHLKIHSFDGCSSAVAKLNNDIGAIETSDSAR